MTSGVHLLSQSVQVTVAALTASQVAGKQTSTFLPEMAIHCSYPSIIDFDGQQGQVTTICNWPRPTRLSPGHANMTIAVCPLTVHLRASN